MPYTNLWCFLTAYNYLICRNKTGYTGIYALTVNNGLLFRSIHQTAEFLSLYVNAYSWEALLAYNLKSIKTSYNTISTIGISNSFSHITIRHHTPWCIVSTRRLLRPWNMSRMRWRPGLRPGPRWGSSQRSPDTLVGWGGGHPVPKSPTPLGASILAHSALAARRHVYSVYRLPT